MNKEITTTTARSVREELSKPGMLQQLRAALPSHMTAERMIRVATTAIQKTPKLLECSQQSLIASIVEASQLGLEPDGVTGLAYLVPFWNSKTKRNEAQLMVGYKGLIDLARRSGNVGAINAECVYTNDEFTVVKGLNPDLIHKPNWRDPGALVAVYATAKLKSGDVQFAVMTIEQVDKHRKRSRAADSGPWQTDFEWMAKKTVLRQLCKLLPASVELQSAIARDELRDVGVMAGNDFIETTASPQPQTLDDAAEALAQEAEAEPDADGVIPDPAFGD